MNNVMNKTQIAEKRYTDEKKKVEKKLNLY